MSANPGQSAFSRLRLVMVTARRKKCSLLSQGGALEPALLHRVAGDAVQKLRRLDAAALVGVRAARMEGAAASAG